MAKNIDGLLKHNADLSAKKTADVKKAVKQLHESGSKITIAAVCKKAGVCKQFIYNHEDLLNLINSYNGKYTVKGGKSKDTTDAHLNIMRQTIREKDKTIEGLKKQLEKI